MTAIDSTAHRPGRVTLASFGAALATLTIAPNVEASIIYLNIKNGPSNSVAPPEPETVPFAVRASSTRFLKFHFTGPRLGSGTLLQANDTIGKSFERGNKISGFRPAAVSSVLNTRLTFLPRITVGPDATGTHYYGFLTTGNELGWLKMNLGGTGGYITYLAVALNDTAGESIHVGVPEPSTVSQLGFGVLALGAAGVLAERRRRKQLTATADA